MCYAKLGCLINLKCFAKLRYLLSVMCNIECDVPCQNKVFVEGDALVGKGKYCKLVPGAIYLAMAQGTNLAVSSFANWYPAPSTKQWRRVPV